MYEYTGIYVPTYLGSRLIPGTKYIRIWHITYVRIDFCRLIPGTAAAFQVFWLVICSNSNEEQTFRREQAFRRDRS